MGIKWPARLRSIVVQAWKTPQSLDARNTRFLYAEVAWLGVLTGITASFLSVWLIRLGGSDFHVGLLSALPALITIFVSIPGGRLVERARRPLSVVVIAALLNRLGYLAIALIPFFVLADLPTAMVAVVGLLTIPAGVLNVAFTTIFARAIQPENRARVVSIRNVWVGLTTTASALVGGKFLEYILFPVNYQLLFAAGFVASMASTYYLTRIELPQEKAYKSVPEFELPRGWMSLGQALQNSPAFTRFTLPAFLFHWGIFFPLPLYPIFWVRTLGATDGWVGLLNTVGSATTILLYPLWGRLAVQRGTGYALFLSAVGLSFYPLITALSPSIEWIILVQLLGGATTAGYTITFFSRLLEVSPEQHRASYIAGYNTLISLAAFLTPLISTQLTEILDIRALLAIGALLRFGGAALLWERPRQVARN